MIVPVGIAQQQLILITKAPAGVQCEPLLDVVFVPLTRSAG